jgi:hypothetical protein
MDSRPASRTALCNAASRTWSFSNVSPTMRTRRRCAISRGSSVERLDQQVLALDAVDAAEHQQAQRPRAVIVA